MEERQWITRAMDGDRTAKAHLFEQTIQNVYYLCLKLTGSAAQAGELTRRTFARAFSHLSELRPDAGFDRWVTAIAVNLCRQTMKKAQPWLFTTDEREMAVLRDTYVADEACLPPECTEDPNLRTQALRTISLLPPEQRVAMVLRYAALMKPHQIAKTMDVDELTVLGRLNCGRRALMTALPSPDPAPLLPFLFAGEAENITVPEVLRGSCMQTVMSAQPAQAEQGASGQPGQYAPQNPPPDQAPPVTPDAPENDPEAEGKKTGFLRKLTKKQKTILFSGAGAALALLVLILALSLRSCGKDENPTPAPKPEPASTEEKEEDTDGESDAAARLREYGVEYLLRCSRREADELRDSDSWHEALNEYVENGDWQDLDLQTDTDDGEVTMVRLRMDKTDLDITRLRDLGLGIEPELDPAAEKITGQYPTARCYRRTPLFDPAPLQTSSLGVYYDGCRYELLDENGDGRGEALIITNISENYDPDTGTFHPYGNSLTGLLGKSKSEIEDLFGAGGYEGEESELYVTSVDGATADGRAATVRAAMQARSDQIAANENVNAILLDVDGCFAELLPELSLPEGEALSVGRLKNKLQSMRGKSGFAQGDVFKPIVYEDGWESAFYYEGNLRYFFCAESEDDRIKYVEVLDLSDCRLWDAASLSFRLDGFDLQDLLGLAPHEAYARYGIRSYAAAGFSSQALGLWDAGGVISTVYNAADPRPLWGISLGDSEESIVDKVEKAGGYLTTDESAVRYFIPDKRELVVTYAEGKASDLKLEDHSRDSGYQPPERRKKTNQELFREFLVSQNDVKASWCGDLTQDGEADLLLCRENGSGCSVQLYVVRDEAVVTAPIYNQTLSVSASTDLYVLQRDDGPVLLFYTLTKNMLGTDRVQWRLVRLDANGAEVQLDGREGSYNSLNPGNLFAEDDPMEEYNAVKQEADAYAAEGTFLCGTQEGAAKFGDVTADLNE